jgi:5-methylcytosine-specific restriction endonuclease McrA
LRAWKACEVCTSPAESHHIVSRGAGGPDEDWNVLNLCRKCHSEVHVNGWLAFGKAHPRLYGRIVSARERAGKHTEGRC